MGQATGLPTAAQLDTVITNALIVDYTGLDARNNCCLPFYSFRILLQVSIKLMWGLRAVLLLVSNTTSNIYNNHFRIYSIARNWQSWQSGHYGWGQRGNGGGSEHGEHRRSSSQYFLACLTLITTLIRLGEGLILTAGGMDSHVHFICPQICDEAIASGLTTMLGQLFIYLFSLT